MLAFSWDQIFLGQNSVDLFNEKCIRASKGACFRIPYQRLNYGELEEYSSSNSIPIMIADMNGEDPQKINPPESFILVLGNEGQGVNLPSKAQHQCLSIPMQSNCESLNVGIAGSILMYLLQPTNKA